MSLDVTWRRLERNLPINPWVSNDFCRWPRPSAPIWIRSVVIPAAGDLSWCRCPLLYMLCTRVMRYPCLRMTKGILSVFLENNSDECMRVPNGAAKWCRQMNSVWYSPLVASLKSITLLVISILAHMRCGCRRNELNSTRIHGRCCIDIY